MALVPNNTRRKMQAGEVALGFVREDLAGCFSAKDQISFEQFLLVIEGKTTGALRASIGLVSTFADLYTYVQFAKTFIDRSAVQLMAAR